jgi:Leucine-rich repeat (LRR) protein
MYATCLAHSYLPDLITLTYSVKSTGGCSVIYSPEQVLNMSGLRLDWVVDSTFSELKKLRVLDLRNNSLRQLQQSSLGSPPALQEVYLSGKLRRLSAAKAVFLNRYTATS